MVNSPVLLLTFNRPDTTQKVLNAIRNARPKHLYISSDGDRKEKLGDKEKVQSVRELIKEQIDWPCEIKTLYRDKNLGCRFAVTTAIDWFFENESEGIILEDDCVPDPSFFRYADDLLSSYRHDQRVMSISGHNYNLDCQTKTDSYFFSRYHNSWGWATWKRAWQYYDGEMTNWPILRESNLLLNLGDGSLSFKRFWTSIFDRTYLNKIDGVWDYRWLFSCWIQSGMSILPTQSLIENIGFGEDSTHTFNAKTYPNKRYSSAFTLPLKHNDCVYRDFNSDKMIDRSWYKIDLVTELKRKLGNIVKTN